jgi:chromate transport protein ChrA
MELVFSLIQQVPISDLVEVILYVIGSAFSLILLSLSISAYRKNPQKRLKYAITAFFLFGVFLTYENFEHAFTLDNPFADIIIPSSTLAILILFFLAITKKN